MFKKLVHAITGDPNEKALKQYRPLVGEINKLEAEFERKSDEELRAMTGEFQQRIQDETAPLHDRLAEVEADWLAVLGTEEQKFARVEVDRVEREILNVEDDVLMEMLPEAFAAVREAGKRTKGMRHYDVQLLGGIILHTGTIAEMRTGEGKTLVATLPLYLNALAGRGVHLVTPNDYLSKIACS